MADISALMKAYGAPAEPSLAVPDVDWRARQEAAFKGVVESRKAICAACLETKCFMHNCTPCQHGARLKSPRYGCPAPSGTAFWPPVDVERLRIAWILSARNEGAEVAATIKSLRASALPGTDLRIIVIDDGSTDGSCVGLPECVVTHDVSQGTARSQDAALSIALPDYADAVGFSDAHMRFPRGILEVLALKALAEPCIVNAASGGMDTGHQVGVGCFLARIAGGLVAVKWVEAPLEGEWWKVEAPLGAAYCVSRYTAERLQRLTGRFWENTAAPWGAQEEGLAIKARVLGIPCYSNHLWTALHNYRKVNPLDTAGTSSTLAERANIIYQLRLLCPDIWESRIAPIAKKLMDDELLEILVDVAATQPVDVALMWGADAQAAWWDNLPEREK